MSAKSDTHPSDTSSRKARPKAKARGKKKRARGGSARTSKRMLAAAVKQARAVELRSSGASFDRIATECGYKDRAGAHKAVMSALRKTVDEPADELRELELMRLDRALEVAWSHMKARGPYALNAIDRVLKIGERRAALIGLDAPEKVDIDFTKLSDTELDAYCKENPVR